MNKTWQSSQTEGEVIRIIILIICLVFVSFRLQGFILEMVICIAGAAASQLTLLIFMSCFSLCQQPGFASVHDSAVNTCPEGELEQQGSFLVARSNAGWLQWNSAFSQDPAPKGCTCLGRTKVRFRLEQKPNGHPNSIETTETTQALKRGYICVQSALLVLPDW